MSLRSRKRRRAARRRWREGWTSQPARMARAVAEHAQQQIAMALLSPERPTGGGPYYAPRPLGIRNPIEDALFGRRLP